MISGGTDAVEDSAAPDEDSRQLLSVGEVFREAYPGLVRLAYLLTGSRETAEDVVQDAFARAQPRWDEIAQPVAYVRTSVVNGARTYHRGRARERAHFADLVRDDVSPETPIVLDALAALPYRQRAALVLRYFEDRPEVEIADVLGCRPSTVRTLVRRGLQHLREVIEP